MRDAEAIPLDAALELAPDTVPAAPNPAGRWREVSVRIRPRAESHQATGRPHRQRRLRKRVGRRYGGADPELVHLLRGRLRGRRADRRELFRAAPRRGHLTPSAAERGPQFTLAAGGVATSGIERTRLWWRGMQPVHHLIDPSSGEPAWTGLVQATAVGATACDAETRSKAAFLSGPAGARANSWRRRAGCSCTTTARSRSWGPWSLPRPRRRWLSGARDEQTLATDPSQHLFWLSSRAVGIIAMLLVSVSVGLGLALSGEARGQAGFRRPVQDPPRGDRPDVIARHRRPRRTAARSREPGPAVDSAAPLRWALDSATWTGGGVHVGRGPTG